MNGNGIRRNERDWAGQLISWIKDAIAQGTTVFQDATNDTGVKLESGRTKFPDVLLFTDRISGIVFNGWEMKFPDTPVDDPEMLDNALEKAKTLKSESFVTWNGADAVIWRIDTSSYERLSLSRIKTYPTIPSISSREDMANPVAYAANEELLRCRAKEILHDLDSLYRRGELTPAINISINMVSAIRMAYNIIVPQLSHLIEEECGGNRQFRENFNQWRIYESSTLKILQTSSRRAEHVSEYDVLAKFTFYNLIGRTLFYLTLSENLSGELPMLRLDDSGNVYNQLREYFVHAGRIDYQAIFQPYFTDCIRYNGTIDSALRLLMGTLTAFDFRILPTEVIGTVLENIVPKDDKQKFGQYFTPEILANLVAFPAVETRDSILFDPTSGTGTFLNSFYQILSYYGNKSHQAKLSQIWGNDISHFPAMLSVINLYKQAVSQTDNFPRVIRGDFFSLRTDSEINFPDSHDHQKRIRIPLPLFDGIASNFPFIQQEDIPNDKLEALFRKEFETEQAAFVKEKDFCINERSDYFTYCIYNSIRFLKDGGTLCAITSNAWLGKEYGIQFKQFLLNNFHIKYVVKSNAEHWFTDSKVSTIYFVLEKNVSLGQPTKFVSLNVKLKDAFDGDDIAQQLGQIERFYAEIDSCNQPGINHAWIRNGTFDDLYHKSDDSMSVAVISHETLERSLLTGANWAQFFVSRNILESFEHCLTQFHPRIFKVIRGERTGWNGMFVIPEKAIDTIGVDERFLVPYVKSPTECDKIAFGGNYKFRAFVCDQPLDNLDSGTVSWIQRFTTVWNKNNTKLIPVACASHKPFWYSINPKRAHIITALNPYKRYFFAYSDVPFTIDQRLIAMQVQPGYDVELIAALMNSAVTFLIVELKGTARNLGALDLNSNYLKTIRILNPDLLSEESRKEIISAFSPLKNRLVGDIVDELVQPDRIAFDAVVLKSFGLDSRLLHDIYSLLKCAVVERVSMKSK